MKRIITVLLAISVALSSTVFVFAFSDTAGHKYENDIMELAAMGLTVAVNGEEYLPDMRTTRGEFCETAVKLLGMEVTAPGTFFKDVPAEHRVYDYVGYAASAGYMIGYGDGFFRPDKSITLGEALKVLVELMGYGFKVKNSGIGGYTVTAKEIGLLKGIDLSFSSELTRGITAKLINNALDIPLPVISAVSSGNTEYEISKDKTLMSEYLGLRRGEGTVTANSLAALSGYSLTAPGQFSVDGLLFEMPGGTLPEYVGYNVRYIYSDDEDDAVKSLLYVAPSDNRELTVDRADYVSFENNVFTYTDDSEKEYEIKLSPELEIIYNGKNRVYSEDMFSSVECGSFTFVSSENSKNYNILYIEEYENMIIGAVNKSEMAVTNELNASEKLKLLPEESDYTVILDENGNKRSFSDLKKGSSISYFDSGEYKKVYINKPSVTGELKYTGDDVIGVEDASYEVVGEAYEKLSTLYPGENYEYVFDRNGRVFYISDAYGLMKNYMYFIYSKASVNPLKSEINVKLYDVKEGIMKTARISEQLTVNREPANNITHERFSELLSEPQLIAVEYNANGEINEIETAKLADEYPEGKDGIVKTTHESRNYVGGSLNCFDLYDYLSSSSMVLSVPSDPTITDEAYYSSGTPSSYFDSGDSYTVSLYKASKESEYVDIVLRKAAASNAVGVSVTTPISVVTRVTEGRNEDGEAVMKVYIIQNGKEQMLEYIKSDNLSDSVGTAENPRSVSFSDIAPGDVIITGINGRGTVGNFRCLYKYEDRSYYDRFSSEANAGAYYRILQRTVTDISTNFITLEKEGTKPVRVLRSAINTVTVSSNGVATFAKTGNTDDVEIGDEVIFQTISKSPKFLVVFK